MHVRHACVCVQACFKLLAALLRECPDYAPPLPLLRHVMRSAFADIAAAPAALFGLLRAVLSGKLLEVVEVYDVMKRVQVRRPAAGLPPPCSGMRRCCLLCSMLCTFGAKFRAV